MDSELRGVFSVLLSMLLLLGLNVNIVPQVEAYTPSPTKVTSSPTKPWRSADDGDAWTENDNATYPWKCSPSFPDTIEFTTENKKVGSYSLKVNHTSATTYMAFYLDLGSENNLSSYDLAVFWLKVLNKSKWTGDTTLGVYKTGAFSGSCEKWTFSPHILTETWIKAVLPMSGFLDVSSPSWQDRRYICFQFSDVKSSDYTTVYVDGLHFATWSDITETASVDETVLPNLWSFLKRWQKTQTYNSKTYTSTYSMIPISGGSFDWESLEAEALALVIYGLALAYEYSGIQFYLDQCKPYVTWLLQFQYLNESHPAHGGFHHRYSGTAFADGARATYQGWVLAGLSLYYKHTLNQTVKTACDRLASFLMDSLWDDANDWFDTQIVIASGTRTDATAWKSMPQGACAVGLASYYKHVTQNSTVESIVNQCLSKGMELSKRNDLVYGTQVYEDGMYAWYGMLRSYEAFNNSTYYNEALKALTLTRVNYEHTGNGSQWLAINCINSTGGFDGWGFACSLPLLFELYEYNQSSVYLELFENQILDLTPQILTGNYSITRRRNSGDVWVNWQYSPSNAFMIGALMAYYSKIWKPSRPYLISTDKEITYSSYSNERLRFTVSNENFAGSTSTTKVCCGDKGEPTTVQATNETLTWSYNTSTTILTLNVTHASPTRILVYWKFPGDIDSDGNVDVDDLYIFARAYETSPPSNPECDLDGDGDVDSDDFAIFAGNYGKIEP
ncbi:MAG: hypothetical protein OEY88_06930 [Candidatus Bathyarchaeota archaeon]|nr:hypothetical protein [Candidatus Bathyarchaeota archaeon]